MKELEAAIEAILFTMGKSVELSKIAVAIEQDEQTTKQLIHKLMKSYEKDVRGIRIIELEDKYQLCTKAKYYEHLIRIASQPKKHILTDTLLETLSIIAYKQPITKIEIDQIRGVKSDHAVNKLIEYELVEEVGRKETIGRPILFATTEQFLRSFGVSSLAELPTLKPEQVAKMKEEAEEEVQVTV